MEPSRAAEGPEIVLSAQSTASVAAVAAESGQKTPQERPKNAPERPQSVPKAFFLNATLTSSHLPVVLAGRACGGFGNV